MILINVVCDRPRTLSPGIVRCSFDREEDPTQKSKSQQQKCKGRSALPPPSPILFTPPVITLRGSHNGEKRLQERVKWVCRKWAEILIRDERGFQSSK